MISTVKAFEDISNWSKFKNILTLPVPIPAEEKKLSEIFIFTLLCGASKGFMKAFNAFSVRPGLGREGLSENHKYFFYDLHRKGLKCNPIILELVCFLCILFGSRAWDLKDQIW